MDKGKFLEAAGNAAVTFVTGLLIFKGWSEVAKVGIADAFWLPFLQSILVGLGSLGFQARKSDPQ
jgi:hypothetical protein